MKDYSKLTKQEASELIANLLNNVANLISEAEAVADATGVSFYYNPGYMGTYTPENYKSDDEDDDWEPSSYGWETSTC